MQSDSCDVNRVIADAVAAIINMNVPDKKKFTYVSGKVYAGKTNTFSPEEVESNITLPSNIFKERLEYALSNPDDEKEHNRKIANLEKNVNGLLFEFSKYQAFVHNMRNQFDLDEQKRITNATLTQDCDSRFKEELALGILYTVGGIAIIGVIAPIFLFPAIITSKLTVMCTTVPFGVLLGICCMILNEYNYVEYDEPITENQAKLKHLEGYNPETWVEYCKNQIDDAFPKFEKE